MPTPPWSPALPAPTWLPALPAPPMLHGPGPPTLHGPGPPTPHGSGLPTGPGPVTLHGPGPPSVPQDRLCSTTLLNYCFLVLLGVGEHPVETEETKTTFVLENNR
ncbi:hypothetical protein PO909_001722 [Leuciscus waleckii]